ncbi:MAG: TonB-dependent receptor, partial [Pseudomonadales bacterium]|nr:TonB-dependent receptor [Pseudomonadales bacterium]
MKKLASTLILSVFAGFTQNLVANTSGSQTILVTATRTEQSLDKLQSFSTVIGRENIEQSQAVDVLDLLARKAGLDMSRNGGRGTTASLFLRGTATNQTLIFVDGVKINTASNGAATLSSLNIAQIDRIEIVRGPASSLYGNDAIGGVIQIFTRRSQAEPEGTLTLGYGTKATQQHILNYGGRIEDTSFNINLSYDETNGIDASNSKRGAFPSNDDEAYRQTGVSINFKQALGDFGEASFSYSRNEDQSEFDNGETNTDLESVAALLKLYVSDSITTRFQASHFIDEQEIPTFSSYFDTRRKSGLWQTDIEIQENNLLTIGLDYYREELDVDTVYVDDNRDNRALFLQDQLFFDEHSFVLGLRHDDNDQFGSEKTWSSSYGYQLNDQIILYASYGTAFKAPTFNDLYTPFQDFCAGYGFTCSNVGDPTLKPETSRSFEVGIKANMDNFSLTAGLYKTNIKNLIVWTPTYGPGLFDSHYQPYNLNDATIHGLDVEAATKIAGWNIVANMSLLNPEDRATGKQLNRRAK